MAGPGNNQYRLLEEQSFRFAIKSKDANAQQYKLATNSHVDDSLFTETRWEVDCLQEYRSRLNECKAQVGKFPLHEWERHTEINEISSNIKKIILQRFSHKPPILTRAWIKFYDIMASFPLFSSTDDCTIRTLFLCEAPGAFVNAMNHYIRSNFCNIGFEWLATTLNPYYEQIDFDAFVLDDRFIQDAHLFRNWFFASTNTGDLLDCNFDNDLKQHLDSTFKLDNNFEMFDCVTGDGAFNCLNDPERQEEMVFKLIFKEVMMATQLLKNDGSMIIKFFTFFSCETISLLYFICNCFKEVICYKPVASKHGNSEIYLVCLKFDRKIYNILSSTISKLQAHQFVLNRDLIPQEFIDLICTLCKEISSRQINSINLNVKLFGNSSTNQLKEITRTKNAIGNAFLQKFNLFSIPVNEQLIFGDRYRKNFSKKFFNLFEDYQYNNSKELFCKSLKKLVDAIVIDSSPNLVTTQSRTEAKPQFVTGTPYKHINNCRFCDFYILKSFVVSHSFLQFSSNIPTSNSLFDGLKDILSHQLAFNIYFYERTPFSGYIDNECNRIYSKGIKYCELNKIEEVQPESPVIHFLDLYDQTEMITSNDFDMCLYLRNTFSRLISNKHLQSGHILVIRFKILLSRLSAGILYIISRAFRKLALLWHATPTDSISPSVFAVLSNYRQLPSQFEFIFDETSHKESWNEHLLELISVPAIVNDLSFFDALFQTNSSSILVCLKHQLANCTEIILDK